MDHTVVEALLGSPETREQVKHVALGGPGGQGYLWAAARGGMSPLFLASATRNQRVLNGDGADLSELFDNGGAELYVASSMDTSARSSDAQNDAATASTLTIGDWAFHTVYGRNISPFVDGGEAHRLTREAMPGDPHAFDAWTVAWELAHNLHCPGDVLGDIASLGDDELTVAVARHPACPHSVAWTLAASPNVDILRGLATNPGAGGDIHEYLAFSASSSDIVGSDAATTLTLSAAFASLCDPVTGLRSPNGDVPPAAPLRGLVALHTDSASLLERICASAETGGDSGTRADVDGRRGGADVAPDMVMLSYVAAAPAATSDVLERCWAAAQVAGRVDVARNVLMHPNCPTELLDAAATSGDSWLKAGVAGNPNATRAHIDEALSGHPDWDIATAFASNRWHYDDAFFLPAPFRGVAAAPQYATSMDL